MSLCQRLVRTIALAGTVVTLTPAVPARGETMEPEVPPVAPVEVVDGEVKLTLSDALARAEAAGYDARISREILAQSAEAVQRSRGDLLPRVDFRASQSRSGGDDVDARNRFSTSLSGSVSLLDTTKIANYAADKRAYAVADFDYRTNVQSILNNVASLYLTHVRNLKRLALNEANIERARVLLGLAQSQLDAGVATQIDVTRAEAQLATQVQAMLQQQTVVFSSARDLKRLLSLPAEARIVVDDFAASRELPESLLALQGAAVLEQRNDYKSAIELLEQNRLEKKAADYQRVPTVAFDASYGYGGESFWKDGWDNNWSFGVSLDVPIFDGFRIGSNKRLAMSRVRAQELRLENLQRQISDEVRVAARDSGSRLAQIAVAQKNADLAAEELRLARIRFEQGVADNREVVDAQNNVAQANDNLNEALYQYNLSRLELSRVRGDVRILPGEGVVAAELPVPAGY